MQGQIFASLPQFTRRKLQGSVFVKPLDRLTYAPVDVLKSVGSASADMSFKSEYQDMRDNQAPMRPRTYSKAVQNDVEIKLGAEQFASVLLRAMHQSGGTAVGATQAGMQAGSTEFDGMLPFQTSELVDANGIPQIGCTITSVTDGTNPLPPGMVRYDGPSGLVQAVTALPKVVVNWSAPAMTGLPATGEMFSIGQSPEFLAEVIVRQNNLDGVNLRYVFPLVQLRAPQGLKLVGKDGSYYTGEFDGQVLWDTRYPGREFGWANVLMDGSGGAA